MKYTLPNGKTIQIPDAELEKLQKILDISKDEAIHTYLVDNDLESDEIVEELTEKAKKNIKRYEKSDNSAKKPRKAREKKENPLKKEIIQAIEYALTGHFDINAEIEVTNPEKYITIKTQGLEFTVNLVQHRTKK